MPEWVYEPWAGCPGSHADQTCCGFPAALAACTQLRRLCFDFSQGDMWLGHLPSSFGRLTQLERLKLVECHVDYLPLSFIRLLDEPCQFDITQAGDWDWGSDSDYTAIMSE